MHIRTWLSGLCVYGHDVLRQSDASVASSTPMVAECGAAILPPMASRPCALSADEHGQRSEQLHDARNTPPLLESKQSRGNVELLDLSLAAAVFDQDVAWVVGRISSERGPGSRGRSDFLLDCGATVPEAVSLPEAGKGAEVYRRCVLTDVWSILLLILRIQIRR